MHEDVINQVVMQNFLNRELQNSPILDIKTQSVLEKLKDTATKTRRSSFKSSKQNLQIILPSPR